MCVMAHGGRGGDERDMSLEKNLSRNDVGLPFGTLTTTYSILLCNKYIINKYYDHNLHSPFTTVC